ncbi:MAG TPA: response regulator [Candidatus Obscuribacterales bacterium]
MPSKRTIDSQSDIQACADTSESAEAPKVSPDASHMAMLESLINDSPSEPPPHLDPHFQPTSVPAGDHALEECHNEEAANDEPGQAAGDVEDGAFFPEALRGKRILLIDDDCHFRNFVRASLEPAGCAVVEASCGRQGLYQWRSSEPDAVIVDYMLRDMDGISIIDEMKALGHDSPVMFLSGFHCGSFVLNRLRTLNVHCILTKPVAANHFRRTLAELIDNAGPHWNECQQLDDCSEESEYLCNPLSPEALARLVDETESYVRLCENLVRDAECRPDGATGDGAAASPPASPEDDPDCKATPPSAAVKEDGDESACYQSMLKNYGLSLIEELSIVSKSLDKIEKDPFDHYLLQDALRRVHTIAGTAGCYGYAEISDIAADAQEILRKLDRASNSASLKECVDRFAASLSDLELKLGVDQRQANSAALQIAVIEAETESGDAPYLQTSDRDILHLHRLTTIEQALTRIDEQPPHAIFVSGEIEGFMHAVNELRTATAKSHIPIFALTARRDAKTLLKVSYSGIPLLNPDGTEHPILCQIVRETTRLKGEQEPRAILVGENKKIRSLAESLGEKGFRVRRVFDMHDFPNVLRSFAADIIVSPLADDDISGLDIVRMTQQCDDGAAMSTFLLCDDREQLTAALRNGAAFAADAQCRTEELAELAVTRAALSREFRSAAQHDPYSGFYRRSAFLRECRHMLKEASDSAIPLAVAGLTLAPASGSEHEAKRMAGLLGLLIYRELRSKAAVYCSGERILLVAHAITHRNVYESLESICQKGSSDSGFEFSVGNSRLCFDVSFSVFPEDGLTIDELFASLGAGDLRY